MIEGWLDRGLRLKSLHAKNSARVTSIRSGPQANKATRCDPRKTNAFQIPSIIKSSHKDSESLYNRTNGGTRPRIRAPSSRKDAKDCGPPVRYARSQETGADQRYRRNTALDLLPQTSVYRHCLEGRGLTLTVRNTTRIRNQKSLYLSHCPSHHTYLTLYEQDLPYQCLDWQS